MNVLDQLTEEHREAEQLMAKVAKTDPGDHRNALVHELTESLTQHMAVEEQFVYPIVVDALGEEPVTEANNEHDLARDGLAKLAELCGEPGFGAALEMLEAGLAHHVEEEERDMFPKLREQAADQIDALDPRQLKAWVQEQGAEEPSRDELYRRAQEVDVPGRSSMTKSELAESTAKQP